MRLIYSMADNTEDKTYDYAHRNTDTDVRRGKTAQYNRYKGSCAHSTEYTEALRRDCVSREIPVSSEETLAFICNLARIKSPRNMLELGTGTGVSGIALLDAAREARLTTIERREDFHAEAVQNFLGLGLEDRVRCILGDAGEVIQTLPERSYDFIFMDCAKVQYVKYLPALKRLLVSGGVLVADDVLIYGWATGEAEVPAKRHMLAQHIQEYLDAITTDEDLYTTVLDIGDGMAVSVLKG